MRSTSLYASSRPTRWSFPVAFSDCRRAWKPNGPFDIATDESDSVVERGGSAVEGRTRNRESPVRLSSFVLSTTPQFLSCIDAYLAVCE